MQKGPQVGDVVVYTDHQAREHNALVTSAWGEETGSLNLVYASSDEGKTDSYGRQIERDTSVPHQSTQPAPGNHWRLP